MSRGAVFVDRDGTVIADPGYLGHPDGLRLLPGAAEAIARLNEAEIPVVMITNQSGIGRGYYSEEDFHAVQRELERRLEAVGARLEDTYFCPHDPTVHACRCRKPGTELFERAIEEHGIAPAASWFVGDRGRDVAPAARWGGRAVLVAGADGAYDEDAPPGAVRVPTLARAVELIVDPEHEIGRASAESPLRVVVLVSGSGSNLQALIDRFADDRTVEISGVIASRAGLRATERAAAAGIPTAVLQANSGEPAEGDDEAAESSTEAIESSDEAADRADEATELATLLRGFAADLVVLAGYLRLVPAAVVREWQGRILNIHPALLPAFGGEGMYGRRVHEAVIESGVSETGVTVHLVDEEYDRGPIVVQRRVAVRPDDDPDRLASRVLEQEHRLLPEVVAAVADGSCRLTPEGAEWRRPLADES